MDKYEYGNDFVNLVLESLENSKEYHNEAHKQSAIGTFKLLVDKFEIKNYMDGHEITRSEYDYYYKAMTKKHRKHVHNFIQKEFKNKEK